MSEPTVLLSKDSEYSTTLTLNRPDVLNALNSELLKTLCEHLTALASDQKTRVIIITGTSDKAFSAGADLKERQGMTLDETRVFLQLIRDTFNLIESMPMPTIAAINGMAFGGGLELALACDMRLMHSDATVGLTECSLGIIPGAGGTQRLPHLVGLSRAKEMIYGAKRIEAREALQIGLVDWLYDDREQLMRQAMRLATQIESNAPLAVQAAKRAINGGLLGQLTQGLALEAQAYESVLVTKDRLEGLKAFQEKRRPRFVGE